MNLILLGAPGSGKGTQAENIVKAFGIPAISTGNIIRENLKNETPLGLKAKAFMDAGELVPDEVVIDIIKDRLDHDDAKSGFVLDGFPRTVPQATALDAMGIMIDKVIEIYVPFEKIEARLTGRRVCEVCGATFHTLYNPPKTNGICDACGQSLIVRKDDSPETVKARLAVYEEQTAPLVEYYKKAGKLTRIVGQEEVADTTRLTLAAVQG